MSARAAIAVALVALSCERITDGQVYEMWREPERDYFYLMMFPIVHSTGESTFTTFMYIPMHVHDYEDFALRIRKLNDKGKWQKRTLYVTKDEWARIQLGQQYVVNGARLSANKDATRRAASGEERHAVSKQPPDERWIDYRCLGNPVRG